MISNNNKSPVISVIMPCFNAEKYIENAVASVLNQSFNDFELLIVDDGSVDNSLDVLNSLAKSDNRLRIVHQENCGAGPARNRGLELAKGKYIAFLDSDDYWDERFLEIMHNKLVTTNAKLAYCGWQNIGLSGGAGNPYIPPDYNDHQNKVVTFLTDCRWPIHGALTYRSVINEAGGFDESLTSCMDFDLWLRIATAHDIVRVPEVLAFYLHHESEQITKNKVRIAFNHLRVQRKYIEDNPEVISIIDKSLLSEITYGELLKKGYQCYWQRDLESSRRIFRKVMLSKYGTLSDWKYMLPSLLPLSIHKMLISLLEENP